MTDIVERLRAFEDWIRRPGGQKEFNLTTDMFDDAADEIERLRAGGCARDQGTTQYCAEAAKLAAENERLREWNREIALNARELVADNERLEAALRDIIADSFSVYAIQVARAALDGQPAPGKEEA